MMDVAIYLTGIFSGIGLVAGLYFGFKAFTRYRKLHEMEQEIHHRRVLNMYGWQDYAYVPPMMFSNEKDVENAFKWMQSHGRIVSDDKGRIIGKLDTGGNSISMGYSLPNTEMERRVIPESFPANKPALHVVEGSRKRT